MKLEAGKVYRSPTGGCPRKINRIANGLVRWEHESNDSRDTEQCWSEEHFLSWVGGYGPGGLNPDGTQRTFAQLYC